MLSFFVFCSWFYCTLTPCSSNPLILRPSEGFAQRITLQFRVCGRSLALRGRGGLEGSSPLWSQDQDYTLTPTLALTPPLLKAAGVEAWGSGERPGILNRVEEEKGGVRLFKHHTHFFFFFEGQWRWWLVFIFYSLQSECRSPIFKIQQLCEAPH